MTKQDKISKILEGTIDLHQHSGPGLIPRSLDHFEAAKDAINAGMRAIVVKDQHSMTCNAIYFIQKYLLKVKDAPFDIFGGLVLNNATGGINPHTVDAAIKYGAKIIWMPTLSSKNHIEIHKKMDTSFPSAKGKLIEETPLTILDENGHLLPQVSQICDLIAEADIILSTGHLHLDETKLLVDKAKQKGIKKILMQHPEFLIDATLDQMIELANKGVFIEHSLILFETGIREKKYLVEMIKAVGAERTTLGSDTGQAKHPAPIEILRRSVMYLLEMGITAEEIDLMLRKNPANLLNLD